MKINKQVHILESLQGATAKKQLIFIKLDVIKEDKWAGNEMHKCKDEGEERLCFTLWSIKAFCRCAVLVTECRIFHYVFFLFFSFIRLFSFFHVHHPQIWKCNFLSISHGIRISGRVSEKLKARRLGGSWCDNRRQRCRRSLSTGTRESYEVLANSSQLLLRRFMAAVIGVGIPRTQGWNSTIQKISDANRGSLFHQITIWVVRRELRAFRMCVH